MPEPGKKEEFTLKVNGVEITISHRKLVAHDILELAEKRGVMPGKPEDYILHGDKGEYGWDDWVDLEEDRVFITIRNAPTPVA